jgi:hypothetical protein
MNKSTDIVLNNTKEIIVDAHTKKINKILNKGDKIMIYSNSYTKLLISTHENICIIFNIIIKFILFIISYSICIHIINKIIMKL